MLIFRFVMAETGRTLLDDEPAWAGWSVGQDGVSVSHPTVTDPLFTAVDFVSDHTVVLNDALRCGLQGRQVAPGIRFGGAIGEQQSLFSDASQPTFLLFRGSSDKNWIAPEKRGQDAGGNSQIHSGHLFADAIDIEGATAEAPELLGDEEELDA